MKETPVQDSEYTVEELRDICKKMGKVSSNFYTGAIQTGCHPFIEFCGLMNEYIRVCIAAAEQKIPFPNLSEHSGQPLPVEAHNMDYIAEKLRCIFGPVIDADPRCREILKNALFPQG
jgi:hypothetical protein